MRIAIIGAGYVGLVTGVCLALQGHTVRLVEERQDRRDSITSGHAPFFEALLDESLQKMIASGNLHIHQNLNEAVALSEVTFIAVGTPPKGDEIDLSQVERAAQEIGKALSQTTEYHVIVVKSTVVPGTTDGLVQTAVEQASGKKVGEFGLCMNPEFLREGSAVEDFQEPDRIVIGQYDSRSGDVLKAVYASFDCPFVMTTLRNAELTKYASNTLLSVLISFSNEMASLCEKIEGVDVDTVLNTLKLDKRLSPIVDGKRIEPQILSYLKAGCGFGGSCLPKDVNALRKFAEKKSVQMPLLNATIEVNERRPKQFVDIIERSLGSVKSATLAILGLSFKPNTDDVRESPSLKVIAELKKRGATVKVFDPLVRGALEGVDQVEFSQTAEECITDVDAAVITTACSEFLVLDWPRLVSKMRRSFIFDGRGLFATNAPPHPVVVQPIGTFVKGESTGGK